MGFDGGDGQMGVAGDGASGLDKSDFATGSLNTNVAKVSTIDKSKARSAKNAWGTSTGYADKLIEKRVWTQLVLSSSRIGLSSKKLVRRIRNKNICLMSST